MVNIVFQWLLVCACTVLLDWVWAKYTLAVTEKRAVRAGVLSALIFCLGGSVVTAYVHDVKLLIPAAIGAFIGTHIACRKS